MVVGEIADEQARLPVEHVVAEIPMWGALLQQRALLEVWHE